jgi:hypothetical protein
VTVPIFPPEENVVRYTGREECRALKGARRRSYRRSEAAPPWWLVLLAGLSVGAAFGALFVSAMAKGGF